MTVPQFRHVIASSVALNGNPSTSGTATGVTVQGRYPALITTTADGSRSEIEWIAAGVDYHVLGPSLSKRACVYLANKLAYTPNPVSDRPAHARQIQAGPDIQQWQEAGTTITSLWMDLEAGMIVQITGQSLDRNPRQGEISVDVINEASGTGRIGRYRGGTYLTPRKVGPVTLTGVTGSLATHNMVVSFSYAGGIGTLVPRTGRFTLP